MLSALADRISTITARAIYQIARITLASSRGSKFIAINHVYISQYMNLWEHYKVKHFGRWWAWPWPKNCFSYTILKPERLCIKESHCKIQNFFILSCARHINKLERTSCFPFFDADRTGFDTITVIPTEPELVNALGAQELIPRNGFRQPM